jgi:PKD repeat protein
MRAIDNPDEPLIVSIKKEKEDSEDWAGPIEKWPSDDWQWVEIDFGQIPVTPEDEYSIVCKSYTTRGGYEWRATSWNGHTYDRGDPWESNNQGGSWHSPYDYTLADFCFVVFGSEGSIAQNVMITGGIVGSRSSELVSIDSSISAAEFSLSWSVGDLDLTLQSPDGRVIDPDSAEAYPNITYFSLPTFEMYSLDSLIPGEWELIINGPGGTEYLAQVIAETYLTINMFLDKESYLKGDSIGVSVSILHDTVSIAGANVTIDITTPTGSDQMILYDDGAHGDGSPDDGVYSNYFTSTNDEGTYTFYANASGTVQGQPFTREGEEKSATIVFQQPFANAGGPYIADVGEPVEFDGSASTDEDGIIVTYDWDFGDENTGSGVNPAHSYSDTGTYRVTLTVTDDNGLMDSTIATAAIGNPFVEITRPNVTDCILQGLDTLKWTAYDASDSTNLDIYLYYSPDTGQTWYQINDVLENTGEYEWNTTEVPDGIYVFKVEAIDQEGNIGTGFSGLAGVINHLRGDANGDGLINSADVAYLINYLFVGGPAPQPLEAGDANCDGTINSADVSYLINYLFVSGPPPGC